MLLIHAVAGLARLLFPGNKSLMTTFSMLNDSCFVMCPKFSSFRVFTLCSSSEFSFDIPIPRQFVPLSVQDIRDTLLAQLFSNALNFISSAFRNVQLSHNR